MKTLKPLLLLASLSLIFSSGCARGIKAFNAENNETATFSSSTPVSVSTSPSQDVGLNAKVYVAFSHKMDATTITSSNLYVEGVAGAVTYDAVNRIAYVKPSSNLSANSTYKVVASKAIRSESGVALPKNFTFALETRSTLNLSPPSVRVGRECVPVGGPLLVTFSEAMDSTTINSSTFFVQGVTGTVSYDPITHMASFTPSSDFAANTVYTATVTTGAHDLGGNGLVSDFTFQFTTCQEPTTQNFCTYSKGGYAGSGTPGQIFDANFSTVFLHDLTIGIYDGDGPQTSARWTAAAPGPENLKTFLTSAAVGASGPLPIDQLNPIATLNGNISTQVATLTLNVGFSGVNGMPAGFGDLTLTGTGTSLDGSTVSAILGIANQALAGNGLPEGYTFSSLNDLINNLNLSFDNCIETDWAKAHLQ